MVDPRLFDYYKPGTDSNDDILGPDPSLKIIPGNTILSDINNEEIKQDVIELRKLIDRLDTHFKSVRELVLVIARKLDESGICARNEICRHLKEILNDKIKDGKISSRWIEECLPKEYKQQYRKSEPSSLSKKMEEKVMTNSGLLVLDKSNEDQHCNNDDVIKNNNCNNETLSKKYLSENQLQSDVSGMKADPSYVCCQKLLEENAKLKHELQQQIDPKPVGELPHRSSKLIINKVQRTLIDKALDNCRQFCFLKFHESGLLVEVTSDRSVEV